MRDRTVLAGPCFTSLLLSACAGGAQVAGTGLDNSASDSMAPYDVAEAAPRTDPRPSASGTNTPPTFPPNYRSRIAVYLVGEYVSAGKGPPEITDPQWRPITNSGMRVSVCLQWPIALLYGLVDKTRQRRMVIFAVPESGSSGRFTFNKKELGSFDRCESEGEMKPFTELTQAAEQLKACHARGESRCVVSDGPTGRDILVGPPTSR
jgi:hypothetical protein